MERDERGSRSASADREGSGEGDRESIAALEELRRSEARLRAIAQRSSDFAQIIGADGVVTYASPAAVGVIGYRPEELVGRSAFDTVHADDRPRAADAFRDLVNRGPGAAVSIEVRVRHKDGSHRWLEANATNCVDHAEIRGIVVNNRDVTERVDVKAKLRAYEAQAHLDDRVASLNTMAAGAAHEINNPLATTASNVEFALQELRRAMELVEATAGSPPTLIELLVEVRSALLEARDGADRVGSVVRSLESLGRTAREQEAVDLAEALDAAEGLAHAELAGRARIAKRYDAAPRVVATKAGLVQLFLNLLLNAAAALPEGTPGEHDVTLAIGTDDDGWSFAEVADTGSGIAPELLPRIFDPFFTTKAVGTAQGLGLSVAHSLVTALGGRIRVSSAPGEGTTVRVSLPAAK